MVAAKTRTGEQQQGEALKAIDPALVREWYRLTHLGRLLEDLAVGYIRKAKGWSYHAPFAGHDGVQLTLGLAFRAGKDFLFFLTGRGLPENKVG